MGPLLRHMTPVIRWGKGSDHTGLMERPVIRTNFDETPFLVIWEVTRACALACVHCRAEAVPCRDPRELTCRVRCSS